MTQITFQIPDQVLSELDDSAQRLASPRAQLIRQAIQSYLEDQEDLQLALKRTQNPGDSVSDWEEVRHDLIGPDQG